MMVDDILLNWEILLLCGPCIHRRSMNWVLLSLGCLSLILIGQLEGSRVWEMPGGASKW